MTIKIECTPRTLNFSGKQIEVEELSVELPFARKPRSLEEAGDCGNYKALVTETCEISLEEFDAFGQNLLNSHKWLVGKGAAQLTVFCALRSKHRGTSTSTSTPKG